MAPRGLNKDRRALLQRLAPDERALFAALRPQITPDILEIIAAADYGTEYEAHLARLKQLFEEENFHDHLAWQPREVLELAGWAPANYTGDGQPITGHRGTRIQAFATLCLLRAYGYPANHHDLMGMNQQLAILLDCLDELDAGLTQESVRFIAWLTLRLPDHDDETGFYLFALAALLLEESERRNDDLDHLLSWAKEAEAEIHANWGGGVGNHPQTWLLRTTHFTIGGKRWVRRAKRLRRHLDRLPPGETRKKLSWVTDGLTRDMMY